MFVCIKSTKVHGGRGIVHGAIVCFAFLVVRCSGCAVGGLRRGRPELSNAEVIYLRSMNPLRRQHSAPLCRNCIPCLYVPDSHLYTSKTVPYSG